MSMLLSIVTNASHVSLLNIMASLIIITHTHTHTLLGPVGNAYEELLLNSFILVSSVKTVFDTTWVLNKHCWVNPLRNFHTHRHTALVNCWFILKQFQRQINMSMWWASVIVSLYILGSLSWFGRWMGKSPWWTTSDWAQGKQKPTENKWILQSQTSQWKEEKVGCAGGWSKTEKFKNSVANANSSSWILLQLDTWKCLTAWPPFLLVTLDQLQYQLLLLGEITPLVFFLWREL